MDYSNYTLSEPSAHRPSSMQVGNTKGYIVHVSDLFGNVIRMFTWRTVWSICCAFSFTCCGKLGFWYRRMTSNRSPFVHSSVMMHRCLGFVHTPMKRITFSCRSCLFRFSVIYIFRITCKRWDARKHPRESTTHFNTLISCFMSSRSTSLNWAIRSSPIATGSYCFFFNYFSHRDACTFYWASLTSYLLLCRRLWSSEPLRLARLLCDVTTQSFSFIYKAATNLRSNLWNLHFLALHRSLDRCMECQTWDRRPETALRIHVSLVPRCAAARQSAKA